MGSCQLLPGLPTRNTLLHVALVSQLILVIFLPKNYYIPLPLKMNSLSFLLCLAVSLVLAEPEMKPSGLAVEYLDVPETCEKKAINGQQLTMHYTGTLEDGTKFDSSLDRNEPFKFQIGVGQVIQGWEEGVLGMCVGEKRRLIVPPQLGYGDQGAGDIIPGGATLYFEIELLDTEDGPAPVNVFKQIDLDSDQQLSREELSGYLKEQMKKGGIVHLVGESKKPKSKTKDRFRPYQHGAQIERLKLPITCDNDQRNGGRIVTYKEVEAMQQAGGEQAQQAQEMLKDQDKLVEEIFSHEDKDKDGYISHEEFSGPKHDEL